MGWPRQGMALATRPPQSAAPSNGRLPDPLPRVKPIAFPIVYVRSLKFVSKAIEFQRGKARALFPSRDVGVGRALCGGEGRGEEPRNAARCCPGLPPAATPA